MEHDNDKPGYRKPPKAGQFKKGQSGNPRGRPKRPKLKSEKEILRQILGEPMTVRENGVPRTVSKGEGMIRMLVYRGLAEDYRSIETIRSWQSVLPERQAEHGYLVLSIEHKTPGEFPAKCTLLRNLNDHDALVAETKDQLEVMREEIIRRTLGVQKDELN